MSRQQNRLQTRLLLAFVTILLLLSVNIGYVAVERIKHSLHTEFMANLQAVAHNFSRINHDNIITYNYAILDRDLRLTKQQMGLEFMLLRYQLSATRQTTTRYGEPGRLSDAETNDLFGSDVQTAQIVDSSERPVAVYRYDIKIGGHKWATLLVGRDMRPHLDTVSEAQRWFVMIGLVVVGLGAIFSWFLSRSLTRPLNQLVTAVEGIGKSAAPVSVPQLRNDEIGKLAEVFAEMQTRIHEQLRRLESANLQMSEQAYQDAVTMLPNRRQFLDILNLLLGIDRFHQQYVAVVFLDINKFKFINDTYGHSAGDIVLRAIAQKMRETLETNCFDNRASFERHERSLRDGAVIDEGFVLVSRFGGDEFAALLVTPNEKRLLGKLHDIETLTEGIKVSLSRGHEVMVTMSAGYALALSETRKHLHLLDEASSALHFAKMRYNTQIMRYATHMKDAMESRSHTEHQLRIAIKERAFQLAYQPIAMLADKDILCFEALLRWPNNPTDVDQIKTVVDIIDEIGLGAELSQLVIEQVVKDMDQWRQRGEQVPAISFNLSPRLLRNSAMVDFLSYMLDEYTLSASQWLIEINESEPLENTPVVGEQLRRLKQMGVRILIDDFGTGYSSLAYLSQFQFDGLKIDRSIIQGILGKEKERMIAEASLEIGKKLGLSVIAEGVETPEQLAALNALECEAWQGYLLAKPMPANAVIEWRMGHATKTDKVVALRAPK